MRSFFSDFISLIMKFYWDENNSIFFFVFFISLIQRIVDHVYKKFAVKKVRPGQQPFMCLDELNQIIQLCGLPEVGEYLNMYNKTRVFQQSKKKRPDRIFSSHFIFFNKFPSSSSGLAQTCFWMPTTTAWWPKSMNWQQIGYSKWVK